MSLHINVMKPPIGTPVTSLPKRILIQSWLLGLGLCLAFGSISTAVAQTNVALDRTLANQAELYRIAKAIEAIYRQKG